MIIVQVKGGKIEISRVCSCLIRIIGTGDAIPAKFNCDQSLIEMTIVKGKVEIHKKAGTLIRTI